MSDPAPVLANAALAPRPVRGFQLLSPAFLDELRARVTLSAVVARSVPLKRAGNEWKACCPFHAEKTPSFWVNDAKGFYHCFGCGAHGDAIRFLTESHGLAFMDAVKELADQAGLDLPRPDPAMQAKAERALGLGELVEQAAAFFERSFRASEGAEARAYAARRGLSAETLADFRIGFAPEGRDRIKAALPGAETALLIEAGLLIEVEGKEPYDRFRNRLIVPIRDPRGRVIAFGGRVLDAGEPKYLNSPETPLFDKGRTLFNLDRAAPAARRTGRLFVVEGYLDAIALDQAGIRETVAPLGTALTETQLELLWRQVDEPTLCFDGDAAGQKAAARAIERALPWLRVGKSLKVLLLPEGLDPDDFINAEGVAGFEALAKMPKTFDKFLYESYASGTDQKSVTSRAELRSKLDNASANCQDKILSTELRRNLIGYFFENFGWKHKDRKIVASSAIKTGPFSVNIMNLFMRQALYGLSRFPQVGIRNLESISCFSISHPDLARWRDAIVEALINRPSLNDDAIAETLEIGNLSVSQRWALVQDRRYAFSREPRECERSVRKLEAMIDVLSQERELDFELSRLTQKAMEVTANDDYMSIETERQRVRERQLALHEQSYRAGISGKDQTI